MTTNVGRWFEMPRRHGGSTSIRWIARLATGLFAGMMIVSGILYLVGPSPILRMLRPLGYPRYFLRLLGVAKLLGVVGLVARGRPRLREWAYAGFTFDLVFAIASHAATDGAAHVPPAIVALALLGVSYSSRRALSTAGGRGS